MNKFSLIRRLALFGVCSLCCSLLLPSVAEGCELCYSSLINPTRSYCRQVNELETGVTNCVTYVDNLGGSSCSESGTYCSYVNAGGGGSGGSGGGGGGNGCSTAGFCPAECFSCGGGGGRPPI
jgi:hypothetical protein